MYPVHAGREKIAAASLIERFFTAGYPKSTQGLTARRCLALFERHNAMRLSQAG